MSAGRSSASPSRLDAREAVSERRPRQGASDDLSELVELAAEQGLWFHADYASARLRSRVAGLERADSPAFDLYTWGSGATRERRSGAPDGAGVSDRRR